MHVVNAYGSSTFHQVQLFLCILAFGNIQKIYSWMQLIWFFKTSSKFANVQCTNELHKYETTTYLLDKTELIRLSSIFYLVGLKQFCIPKLRSSSIWNHIPKISFLGFLERNWGSLSLLKMRCLPFSKKIEVIFHISSS